jgi:hypothetical protein
LQEFFLQTNPLHFHLCGLLFGRSFIYGDGRRLGQRLRPGDHVLMVTAHTSAPFEKLSARCLQEFDGTLECDGWL